MTTVDATAGAPGKKRLNLAPIQKFGRSLMLPIAALPVAALLLRFGAPDMLGADGLGWDKVAAVLFAGGNALFANLPLLFCVGVAIGMAKKADGSTALAAVVGYLVFRPRQRVTLSSDTPVRPHMAVAASPERPTGKGIADEAARATGDVAGQILGANVSGQLPTAQGEPDDLQKLKGVGPKLAAMLNAMGLTRFEQIASLSPGQVESIDAELGAFRGRLTRDRIVEQAHYLARGDQDGYRQHFGAL